MGTPDLLGHGGHVLRPVKAVAGPWTSEGLDAEHPSIFQVPNRLKRHVQSWLVEQCSQGQDLRRSDDFT